MEIILDANTRGELVGIRLLGFDRASTPRCFGYREAGGKRETK